MGFTSRRERERESEKKFKCWIWHQSVCACFKDISVNPFGSFLYKKCHMHLPIIWVNCLWFSFELTIDIAFLSTINNLLSKFCYENVVQNFILICNTTTASCLQITTCHCQPISYTHIFFYIYSHWYNKILFQWNNNQSHLHTLPIYIFRSRINL